MNESDLLLVFGASFANHTGIASYKPIVQVDSDPDALGRFHAVTVPMLGDIAVTRAPSARGGRTPRRSRPIDQRDDVARPLRDLGRGETAAALPTTAATASRRPRCSTRSPAPFPRTR